MTKGLFNKKIPTILGILFLLAAVGAGVFVVGKGNFNKTAAPIPQKIFITNIADNQFTISWITPAKDIGWIKYGETANVKTTVPDDRDQLSGDKVTYLTHYVTVKNLQASKTYYFKIGSGTTLFDNNGKPYTVTLGPALNSAGEAKIVSGKISNPNNSSAQNVIVYLNSSNLSPASALTDKEGRYAIFLNKVRNNDLSSYALFDSEATILKIDVQGEMEIATAITITKNAFPVPDIMLGHSPYDFREQNLADNAIVTEEVVPSSSTGPAPILENTNEAKQPSQFLIDPLTSPSVSPTANITPLTITNPAVNSEEINTARPEITGTGPALAVLTITIHSENEQTYTVTVDENGNWKLSPPADLGPGEHTVTVTYVDDKQTTKSIARNFVVLAAGQSELPALTATVSASMAPSPLPSPSISSRATLPSTQSGVPRTGTIIPTYLLFTGSLILLVLSYTLFVFIDKRYNL